MWHRCEAIIADTKEITLPLSNAKYYCMTKFVKSILLKRLNTCMYMCRFKIHNKDVINFITKNCVFGLFLSQKVNFLNRRFFVLPVTERYDPNQSPLMSFIVIQHQRPSRITLTCVSSSLVISRTKEHFCYRLYIEERMMVELKSWFRII